MSCVVVVVVVVVVLIFFTKFLLENSASLKISLVDSNVLTSYDPSLSVSTHRMYMVKMNQN